VAKFDHVDPGLLPSRIADLVDVVGPKAALTIVELRGGARLYVPSKATAEHWLAEHIGIEALQQLSKIYGGEWMEVDRCAALLRAAFEAKVVAEFDRGASNCELALRYGYTERGIRKLRRRVEEREPSPNLDLFEEL